MREAARGIRIETHSLQQFCDPVPPGAALDGPMDIQRLTDDLIDAKAGIEARIGILENDLEPAPIVPHLPFPQSAQVDTVEKDPSLVRLDEAEGAAAGGGLARSGLTDETHDGAALHVEADAVDGLDRAVAGLELLGEPLDAQESFCTHRASCLQHRLRWEGPAVISGGASSQCGM